MKKVSKYSITNIKGTDQLERIFLFDLFIADSQQDVRQVIYLSDLLVAKKNHEVLAKTVEKPAMYSNVYAPGDELIIFTELFDTALKNNKKIHIIGITLDAEIKILESYYESLGFMRADINCFDVDFSQVLVTASVKIENIMWKGSDYKAQREKIFFCPPIRESGEVKAMMKGINRGVTAGIYIGDSMIDSKKEFLKICLQDEKILSITLAKVLGINEQQSGLAGINSEFIVKY